MQRRLMAVVRMRVALHRRQRAAEVVRDVGDEFAPEPVGAFEVFDVGDERVGHLVERRRKLAEFVRRRDGDAPVELAFFE